MDANQETKDMATQTTEAPNTAAQYAAALKDAAHRYWIGEISDEEHHGINRPLWDEIDAKGLHWDVCAILRRALPGVSK